MEVNSTPPFVCDKKFESLSAKPLLKRHLADLAVRSLARRPLRKLVVDHSAERRELTGGMILAVAYTLGQKWKSAIPEERVGVVFPAGLGGIIANLALSLIGKIPVNLNFTSGRSSLEASMAKAGIRTVITAGPVIKKIPDFPWPEQVIDLVRERAKIRKSDVLKKLLQIIFLPSALVARLMKVPQAGGEREAGLLFSSGSTGEPKGIVLTHRNIIANILQIQECELLGQRHRLLACLPTFHSFGFTVTLWYPLITGMRTVTVPSPLDTKKIAEVIEAEKCSVMMGTPTFYRPFFKRVQAAQLASLEYVVGGAEKTPPGFAAKWQETFGSLYLEGYGLTETAPVVSVNLPPYGSAPARTREGSVGQLCYGMRARITDPASGKVQPLDQPGILELQGANVFPGYLGEPEATDAVFNDGWFVTGDLARIDEDDYIFIEGRLSRFSKIGGEMVPHGRIEQVITECFGLEDAEAPLVAVTGVADPGKGEALILLAAVEIRADELRKRLVAKGLPNLWIPRVIRRVDYIPCLASGKLDLQQLGRLAKAVSGNLPEEE